MTEQFSVSVLDNPLMIIIVEVYPEAPFCSFFRRLQYTANPLPAKP